MKRGLAAGSPIASTSTSSFAAALPGAENRLLPWLRKPDARAVGRRDALVVHDGARDANHHVEGGDDAAHRIALDSDDELRGVVRAAAGERPTEDGKPDPARLGRPHARSSVTHRRRQSKSCSSARPRSLVVPALRCVPECATPGWGCRGAPIQAGRDGRRAKGFQGACVGGRAWPDVCSVESPEERARTGARGHESIETRVGCRRGRGGARRSGRAQGLGVRRLLPPAVADRHRHHRRENAPRRVGHADDAVRPDSSTPARRRTLRGCCPSTAP